MATEYQDLSIRVLLPDIANASAMIGKLKSELRDLGGGAIRELLDKLRTQTKDLGKGFEEFSEKGQDAATAAYGLSRAVRVAGVAGTALGAAFSAVAVHAGLLGQRLLYLGRIAEQTGGITAAQLNNMQRELGKFGVAPEVLTKTIEGVRSKLADLTKINSETRRQLLAGAKPGSEEEMLAWAKNLEGLIKNNRLTEALNEIGAAQQRIYDNAIKSGKGEMFATDQVRKFLEVLGASDPELRRFFKEGGKFGVVSPEEEKRVEAVVASMKNMEKIVGRLKVALVDIMDQFAHPFLTAFGVDSPTTKMFEKLSGFAERIAASMKEWNAQSKELANQKLEGSAIMEIWKRLFGGGGATASPMSFGGVPGAGGSPILMPASFRGGYGGTSGYGGARVIPASYGGGGGYGAGGYGYGGGGYGYGGGGAYGGGGGGAGGGGGGYARLPSGPGGIPMPGGVGASAGGFGVSEGILPPNLGAALGAGLPGAAAPAGGGGGAAAIAAQRASRIAEINNNPALKDQLQRLLWSEARGSSAEGRAATVETLLNRSIMTGNTIEQELNSGFYGPINTGSLPGAISNEERMKADAAIMAAAGGSFYAQGRTDQGSGADPNVGGPGRISVPGARGEVFNYWRGRRGGREFTYEDSRRFAEAQAGLYAGGGGGAPNSILQEARKVALLGPGPLAEYMRSKGYPQSSAWCGDFAASVIKSAGGAPPKNPSIASNWRNWGTAVDSPQPGDIAVRKYSRFGGGYTPTGATGSHVTIVGDVGDNGTFSGIGGNQSSRVSRFITDRFEFRRGASGEGPGDWTRQGQQAWPGAGDDRDVRSSKFLDRRELDRAMGREITSRVEGTGQIDVNVRAPRGTSVTAKSGGIFKRSAVNRQTQMEPARSGPPEPVSGVGSRDIPAGIEGI